MAQHKKVFARSTVWNYLKSAMQKVVDEQDYLVVKWSQGYRPVTTKVRELSMKNWFLGVECGSVGQLLNGQK